MKALVFHKPKDVSVDTVEDPTIEEPTDAIIKITATAICGSDLHIYNGFMPQPQAASVNPARKDEKNKCHWQKDGVDSKIWQNYLSSVAWLDLTLVMPVRERRSDRVRSVRSLLLDKGECVHLSP